MFTPISRQQFAATALVESGFSRWTRQKTRGGTAILTFHGLRRDETEPGLLDSSLHLPVSQFRSVCAHLAEHYEVVPLEQALLPPPGEGRPRVALTFDDGYHSNLRLGLPVLREFGLPATVFVSTAFVEGHLLWFQKLDLALKRAAGERLTVKLGGRPLDLPMQTLPEVKRALAVLLASLKQLPWAELNRQLEKILAVLAVDVSLMWPEELRPLSQVELLELGADGFVEIGGHTHWHPILSNCTEEEAHEEIVGGAQRLAHLLGRAPRFFAYPNGGVSDFDTRLCSPWLREAGYEAAFSMIHGRTGADSNRWALPRYGAPETVREAEATVSGAFEVLKSWRQHFKRRAAL